MIYRDFNGVKVSALGMGNMRLPRKEGSDSIDEGLARAMLEKARASGVNYFDTAYRYHNGESELLVGKVLEQFPRDSFYLATKMPGHMMKYLGDGKFEFSGGLAGRPSKTPAEVFEDQLERCRVNYFDYYLLHNVSETSVDFYTSEEIGVVEHLIKQKEKGRIRHFGFSSHGRTETLGKFLDWSKTRFGDIFGFVQIQLNYLDWILRDAGKQYELITERGLKVVVMEPVRGGRLAQLNEKGESILKKARPGDSVASWAFRYLQALPNIPVILSGMTSMEQLEDNLKTFAKDDPVTEAEKKLLDQAVSSMGDLVPCTACRYCCEACPQSLDIPALISVYNESLFGNPNAMRPLRNKSPAEMPAACVACGSCVSLCPQNIQIPEVMKKAAAFAAANGGAA